MRDELLTYYEKELTFIRRMAGEFADKYPKIAGRLFLERGKCEDPHVERLIESFALLAARIHLKIDDEFPEITESLLQILYPHYLAPVPSMSIVQFELDPQQGKVSTGYPIPRHQTLYSRPAQDTICRFRTAYPVTLWPLEVAKAHLEATPQDASGKSHPAAIVLRLRTVGEATLSELAIDTLRVYLAGESQTANELYEALFGSCTRVELRSLDGAARRVRVTLPAGALGEVGFGKHEGLLPYSNRSFLGYRLLQEYFHFPEKFLFFDVKHLGGLRAAGSLREIEVVFFLDRAPRLQTIDAQNFRLGCTPVVNLFAQLAEPIRLDHAHTEYRVIADVRRQRTTEVYSVDAVTSISPATGASMDFQPFYSFKHSFDRRSHHAFWHATRRPSERKDDQGTEMYLSLVDLQFKPALPPTDVITVQVTCMNRDLPGMLPFGDPDGDFDLEGAAPIKLVRCLTKPSRTMRLPLGHGSQWRLISHLSLNYLSPVEWGGEADPQVLQEVLKLYDFSESSAVQQQIAGIVGVESRQVTRRIPLDDTGISGFARGIQATLVFDESKYVGSGLYLFSSILEKFLGLYVSINSFSELKATSAQGRVIKQWAPRTGYQALL